MTEGRSQREVLLVATDSEGRVVAAALTAEDAEIRSGLEALDGQIVHELEIPRELASLDSPHAIVGALAEARVTPGGVLKMRRIRQDR